MNSLSDQLHASIGIEDLRDDIDDTPSSDQVMEVTSIV